MTTSNQGPRPVGPPPPPRARPVGPPPPGGDAAGSTGTGQPADGWQSYGQPGSRVEWRTWSWSSSRRPVPWLAILLLVLGIGLLIELLIPELTFFSIVLMAAGVAFGVVAIRGRVVGATLPALVLISWALARMGVELGYLTGEGWTALFVGIAFLIGWGLGRFQRARRQWALVLGLVLGVIGLADVSDTLKLDLDMTVIIPVALIVAGIYLIVRDRMPRA